MAQRTLTSPATASPHASTAESVAAMVRDALAAGGENVRGVAVTSVEPHRSGAVVGVVAELVGREGAEHRTCYVDTSHAPARMWVHPDDPRLPALAASTFPHSLSVLLARVGVDGALGDLELVAYRPGRRAVVRARCVDRTVFVKVVRPERTRSIVERHRMSRAAGLPVPAVLGWSPAGAIVLEEAAGTALSEAVHDLDAAAVVREVERLRSRIAAVGEVGTSVRPPVPDRAEWYGDRLVERMPHLADRVRSLAECAAAVSAASAPHVVVHGDLHAGQLFVDPASAAVTGLIDVDTLADGEIGTDVGAFLAHALASAELADAAGEGHRAAGFRRLASEGASTWLRPHDGAGDREIASARRHAVGQLLAQAMHLVVAHGLERSATRLISAAERIGEGLPAVDHADEESLMHTTTMTHPNPSA